LGMRQIQRFPCIALAALLVAGVVEAQSKPAAKAKPAAAETKSSKAAVAAPKIEVVPETKDAGIVAKGQVIETTFVVKNNGGSDLLISDARPGCGCTVANYDRVIKPGAEGKVVTSVDTKAFTGPISKSVLLVSNDPERGQINLFIKATVKPFVDILPQPYVRVAIVKGDSDSRDVILLSEEKTFKPTVAEVSQNYVKAEIAPAGEKDKIPGHPGEQYRVRITVTPDAPEGLLNAPVRIATGVSQQPMIEIPISGVVRARVSVTPVLVNFGNFTAGKDPITRNIVVTNNKPGTPVKVTRAEVSIPGFITDVVPTQEGISYTVVVKASDKIRKGALDGTVKLYTTDKEKPMIELPLRGEVL
ncbi:MAG TPA: DUF1573 domain-containing protein, partial [Thermoanaerobaculia bacterium]|nr:DUF1573 domain-containing protein [Thermoanaerobaculia bacterium]